MPPGRARLATRPPPSGSVAAAKTMGMADVTCFGARAPLPTVTIDIHLELDELGSDLGKALVASLSPAIIDRDRAPLDPTKLPQSSHRPLALAFDPVSDQLAVNPSGRRTSTIPPPGITPRPA